MRQCLTGWHRRPGVDAAHQHRVWEEIADSFSASRTRTWPHVAAFLTKDIPNGGRVLDLMAGNGRHTGVGLAAGHDMVALDWSRPLCAGNAVRRPEASVIAGDATALPFGDEQFDACIYVAGLHGIPTAEGRLESLLELRRVLRRGALAQITVWSRDAPRFRDQGEPGEPVDVVIPWRSGGHDAPRTYHLYSPPALRRAVEAAGFEVVAQDAVAVVSRDGPDNLVIVGRA